MKTTPFVHLHLHTQYSLLDGACRPKDIMERAEAMGMTSVAITDHGVMYGVVPFFKEAKAKGIKAIIGCEMYVARHGRLDRTSDPNQQAAAHHLVLLAEDEAGYGNLVKLATAAHLEGFYYKPRIDKEILAAHRKGLIGLSSCLQGEVADLVVNGQQAAAQKAAGEYEEILGKGNFYLEVQDHSIPEQRTANRGIIQIARKTGMPLVATNDVHYLLKEHAAAHEVLLCLQTQTVMSDPDRMRYPSEEFYLKSGAEMAALFADVPEAIRNTVEIADRCRAKIPLGQEHFPVFAVPKGYDQKGYLVHLCHEGLKRRYGIENPGRPRGDRQKEIVERFRYELGVIETTKFINYFLVVWDFVHFARSHGIPVGPGRGSGAGSLVAYILGITGLDPLRYGLIFERFLNPERVSPPDFDIDFCQSRRGEVIEYVKNKYGRENVAQIVTFASLGARNVIRDVGRVFEIPYAECDRWTKMIPEDPKITLPEALKISSELKSQYEGNEACRRVIDNALVLEGLSRNTGTHAAGVVIGEKPLAEIIPLARDKDKEIITQYTMEPLGEIGLLKMDFLGLKTLTVIQEAVDLVRQTKGVELDIDALPLDDKATYDLLKRGDTVCVFQLESGGMRDLVRRVGVDRIEDLIAMIALYRPGPMNMLDDYVARKTGKAPIEYDHPLLKPILEETYGVMLYQEQVQKAANVLAGYSLGQGDILRRAMGKKKAEEMEKQRATFVKGCLATAKIPAEQAERIFDTLARFAGYGFNKSHSAAYGIIAYQTAYLKAHYPAEFMAAMLSSEMGNADKLPVFIREAREMGLTVQPPDVNRSGVRFTPIEGGIVFGLAGVKNVGSSAAESFVAERERGGPYRDLVDLVMRVEGQAANRKVFESLIRCGACDCFGLHRARMFNGLESAMGRAAASQRDKKSGQTSLFALLGDSAGALESELPDCEPWHESRLLADEKELLGFYLSGHPLSQFASTLEKYQLAGFAQLAEMADQTLTRIGGLVAKVSQKVTKKKEPMAVIELETLEGSLDVIVYPEAYRKYAPILQKEKPILVCGEVRQEERPKIVAAELYPLEDGPRLFARRVSIHVPVASFENGKVDRVRRIAERYPGDVPLVLCLEFSDGRKVFVEADRSLTVVPTQELIAEVEHEVGEDSVFVAVNPAPCLESRSGKGGRGGRRRGDDG